MDSELKSLLHGLIGKVGTLIDVQRQQGDQIRGLAEQVKANTEQTKANTEQTKANTEQTKANTERLGRVEGRLDRVEGRLTDLTKDFATEFRVINARLDEQGNVINALIPTQLAAVPRRSAAE